MAERKPDVAWTSWTVELRPFFTTRPRLPTFTKLFSEFSEQAIKMAQRCRKDVILWIRTSFTNDFAGKSGFKRLSITRSKRYAVSKKQIFEEGRNDFASQFP
jgi:hypothetical protein